MTPKTDMHKPDTWAVLGGLRFALALVVFLTHAGQFFPLPAPLSYIGAMGGFSAVCAFFLVSGYSIAHSSQTQPKGFYGRRVQRLYPVHLTSVVLAMLPFCVWGPIIAPVNGAAYLVPESVWTFVGNALFLQGFAVPRMVGPAWSLTYEAVFYLFAPLFVRLPSRVLAAFTALSALLYAMHRTLGVSQLYEIHAGLYAPLLLWAWLAGWLLYRHPAHTGLKFAIIAGGAFLVSGFNQDPTPYSVFFYGLAAFAICYASSLPLSPRMAGLLTYGGEISYPLYLCHAPLLLLIAGCARPLPGAGVAAAAFAGCLLVYHIIDKPLQAYFRRRSRARRPAPLPTLSPLTEA